MIDRSVAWVVEHYDSGKWIPTTIHSTPEAAQREYDRHWTKVCRIQTFLRADV